MAAKRKARNRCPLVMVEWVDSAQPRAGWQFLADVGNPGAVKCVSVGWLVADGKENKSIAPNMGAILDPEHFQVSGVITIPTRCVTKVTRLREPSLSV